MSHSRKDAPYYVNTATARRFASDSNSDDFTVSLCRACGRFKLDPPDVDDYLCRICAHQCASAVEVAA